MKGREMIFLVNAFIFMAGAAAIALYARLVQRSGRECPTANQTLCDRSLDVGFHVAQFVPWLFVLGVLLLGTAVSMVAYRRWSVGTGEAKP